MPVLMCGLVALSQFSRNRRRQNRSDEKTRSPLMKHLKSLSRCRRLSLNILPFSIRVNSSIRYIGKPPPRKKKKLPSKNASGQKKLYAYLEIPKDVFTNGDVRFYARTVTNSNVQNALRRIISDIVRDKRFAESDYSRSEVSPTYARRWIQRLCC